MRKTFIIAKRLLSILLIFILMLGTVGCMFKQSQSKAEAAIEYMEEKYDDKFTFDGYPVGDSSSIVFLKSEKFPDANVQVNGNKLENGEYEFWDNYVDCKYENQTREFLKDFFESIFNCEVKVFPLEGMGVRLSNHFDDETTLDEFIHSPYNSLGDCVMVSSTFKIEDEDTEQILNKLKDRISEENIIIGCLIYFCPSQEEFDLGLKNGAAKLLKMSQLYISMSDYNEYLNIIWRNI